MPCTPCSCFKLRLPLLLPSGWLLSLPLVLREPWKCVTCRTPPAASSSLLTCCLSPPLSPARGSASLSGSFLFTSNPGDAGAVTCCPGYICTRYLFSHVNIHQAIPNLVEAADKSPLASLRELNMWCSPCSSSAMHLKANPSPRGHEHKATPTAKQEYSIRSAALGVIGMDG